MLFANSGACGLRSIALSYYEASRRNSHSASHQHHVQIAVCSRIDPMTYNDQAAALGMRKSHDEDTILVVFVS